jgi:cytochrome c-type biogenesis protein
MLPAYLSLVVAGESGSEESQHNSKATAMIRALVATAIMALGFILVFGAFGLVLAPLATSVQRYLPAAAGTCCTTSVHAEPDTPGLTSRDPSSGC